MKKGKFIVIGSHGNVKMGYGTVDFKNLKTIYIQLNSWIQPTLDEQDFDKLIYKSRKKIKDKIYLLNSEFFKPQSIVDLDIKTNGVKINKRSFMDLEITLYVNKHFDVRSKEIKNFVSNLSKDIIDTVLIDKTFYNFFDKKN
jgi:hypothetical protein